MKYRKFKNGLQEKAAAFSHHGTAAGLRYIRIEEISIVLVQFQSRLGTEVREDVSVEDPSILLLRGLAQRTAKRFLEVGSREAAEQGGAPFFLLLIGSV